MYGLKKVDVEKQVLKELFHIRMVNEWLKK